MKKKLLFCAAAALGAVAVFCVPALGQSVADSLPPAPTVPDVTADTDVDQLLTAYSALYGALVLLLGYVGKWIPGLNKVPGIGLRVLTIGIVTGVIFKALGLADGWQLAIAFIGATLTYDKVTSNVKATPKAAVDK